MQSWTPDIWDPPSIRIDAYCQELSKGWRLEYRYFINISSRTHLDSNHLGFSYNCHDICDMEAICGVFLVDLQEYQRRFEDESAVPYLSGLDAVERSNKISFADT